MFSLHVDATSWRAHADTVKAQVDGLVPVAKGNGYGFGISTLAREASRLGCDTLAVGQFDEVALAQDCFPGDVLVLAPWHPWGDTPLPTDERLLVTAAHRESLPELGRTGTRTVVELLTSMRRFGLDEALLEQSASDINRLNLAGFALHLPIDDGSASRVEEVSGWVGRLRQLNLAADTLWVSHLVDTEVAQLGRRHPETTFRPRIGTRLWLAAPETYHARGTVLAVHPIRRGQRFGYRQHRARSDGQLLVIAGGTSHGVALAAPRSVRTVTARAKAAAVGGLEAGGRWLSPFRIDGKRRWFAEPPHMQVSMVWLPAEIPAPDVGDHVDVDIRMTTATFDRTHFF